MIAWDQLLQAFWQGNKPFVLLMALCLLGAYVLFLPKRHRLAAVGIAEIDGMTRRDFEPKMALLFEDKDFRVEQAPYSGDWGADLVFSRDDQRTAESSRDRPAGRRAPKCFKCGREMVLKENARGRFWACSGLRKCRHTFPARS